MSSVVNISYLSSDLILDLLIQNFINFDIFISYETCPFNLIRYQLKKENR